LLSSGFEDVNWSVDEFCRGCGSSIVFGSILKALRSEDLFDCVLPPDFEIVKGWRMADIVVYQQTVQAKQSRDRIRSQAAEYMMV
jgi:hypothetical protein